jgi:type II secretory pathway predicted ATPase ExeA
MHEQDRETQGPANHTLTSPTEFIYYRSQQDAFTFFRQVLADDRSVGFLHGPELSGKSTVVRQFARELPAELAVAVVDGTRLKTPEFLAEVLAKFGYDVVLQSSDELLSMLSVFVVQQTRAHEPPVLILENINNMYPGALCALCKLAALSIYNRFALRIILVGENPVRRMLDSPGLQNIAVRLVGDYELGPLTAKETLVYLHTKAEASGVESPGNLFPVDTCDKLHQASGGLPGELSGIAVEAIEKAARHPREVESVAAPELPKLMVTLNGEIQQEIELDAANALIGRSSLSDVLINNRFISKHHALLIRVEGAIHLVDLNSRNGTFVNSKRISSRRLRHEDIISIGDHRIKILDPGGAKRAHTQQLDLADTASMKNIAEMRRQKALEKLAGFATPQTGSRRD